MHDRSPFMKVNMSFITNAIALLVTISGWYLNHSVLFSIGVFALSGALTNWLAVHMLFERVPGLYGSGVIPANFEVFKSTIRKLMMEQFFNEENIDRFLNRDKNQHPGQHLTPVIEKLNLEPAFDCLIKTIMESSFGGMLSMLGGQEALVPLKTPFIDNMRESIVSMSTSDEFSNLLIEELEKPEVLVDIRDNIQVIIEKRLDELTPQLVKSMIQDMIHEHLGWLVIWGGLFGGLIGLLTAILDIL